MATIRKCGRSPAERGRHTFRAATATLTEFEQGRGYWIRMTNPATWVVPGSTSSGPAVIHIHGDGATSWNGSSTNYWDYVNQSVVNDMVDRGVQELTGAATVAQAWQALIPSYQPGQGIAIKLNFNNTFSCDSTEGAIDGIIHPVNGVVRGLKQMGVQESDIWVYDAIRALPDRFVNGCQYSGVRFFDSGCRTGAGFYGTSDPDAEVAFNPPGGVPSPAGVYISDVLINATYLINMPIMKTHCCTGISLGFKNHYGTINDPGALHNQAFLAEGSYRSDYSPTVDVFQNPHIANKTVLTIGDGIFAALVFDMGPSRWATFGNQVPESLFFATDPVAIDCVLCDFLAAETSFPLEATTTSIWPAMPAWARTSAEIPGEVDTARSTIGESISSPLKRRPY